MCSGVALPNKHSFQVEVCDAGPTCLRLIQSGMSPPTLSISSAVSGRRPDMEAIGATKLDGPFQLLYLDAKYNLSS